MSYAKQWRQAAREAMRDNLVWLPTNLESVVNYYKSQV